MVDSTHAHGSDERNKNILINVNGELFPRDEARVSVFDSGFVLGDGVWEGLRVQRSNRLSRATFRQALCWY